MGTRLRNLKKEMAGKRLRDNKTLGGRGRLTDKRIDQFASYYGNAIRGSKTAKEMHNKIWTIWYHYRSTDEKPEHHLCPTGSESWCKYNRAKAAGTVAAFKHSSSLPVPVMDAVQNVFKDLSSEDLLQKCVGGYTQNPNESLNALIWKNVSKTEFCAKKVVEIGVCDAVLLFNGGQKSRVKVLRKCGVEPGQFCVKYCNETDNVRVKKAKRKSFESTKEARKSKRQAQKDLEERMAVGEGPSYAPGAF